MLDGSPSFHSAGTVGHAPSSAVYLEYRQAAALRLGRSGGQRRARKPCRYHARDHTQYHENRSTQVFAPHGCLPFFTVGALKTRQRATRRARSQASQLRHERGLRRGHEAREFLEPVLDENQIQRRSGVIGLCVCWLSDEEPRVVWREVEEWQNTGEVIPPLEDDFRIPRIERQVTRMTRPQG